MRVHPLIPGLLALFAAGLSTTARAEHVKVVVPGAFQQVVVDLALRFETDTHNQVDIVSDTAGALGKRVDAGEDFDVLVLAPPQIQAYARAGRLVASSTADLASVGIGVAVKAGTPRPDIATVATFRQALLNATHVAYVDPASGGSSGPYLVALFARLGVAEAVARKAVLVKGGAAAATLVDGTADIAIQPISELLPVPGVTVVGPLPDEIQRYIAYAGGVNAASKHRAAADAFIALLGSADAAVVMRAKGMRSDR